MVKFGIKEAGAGEKKKRDKLETESMRSGGSSVTTGSKLSNRAIVKNVIEQEWEFIRTDEKSNKYYACMLCNKKNVRGDNRRTHTCV